MSLFKHRKLSNLSFLEFINSFSILVIAGVPTTYAFFAKMLGAEIDLITIIILALAVAVIYTLDHIIDGYKWKDQSHSLRHYLHYKYRSQLLIAILILVFCIAFLAIFRLDQLTKNFGLVISAVVALYIFLNYTNSKLFRSSIFLKELVISMVVSACFIFLPIVKAEQAMTYDHVLLFLGMVLLNFSNLMLFTYYDLESDTKAEFKVIKNADSTKRVRRISIYSMLASTLFFASFMLDEIKHIHEIVVIGVMLMVLLMIWFFEGYFAKNERYRFTGDLIYLIPLIYLVQY